MNDLGPEAKAVLASYKRERPGGASRARNHRAVQRRIASRPSSLRRQLAWGFAAAAAAALLLLVLDRVLPQADVMGVEREPPGSQAVHGDADEIVREPVDDKLPPIGRVEPSPSVVSPEPEPEPEPTESAPEPSPRVRARPEREPAPAATTESLAAETQLLDRARTALGRGDLDGAQSALDEHARRFRDGVLQEDRIAYATIVACRRGDADRDAKRRAFLQRYPRSPHRPRIDEACG